MQPEIIKQIHVVLNQYIQQKKSVPHIEVLQSHPLYGEFFQGLNQEEHQQVALIIRTFITDEIMSKKTVGGEMFRRYYELYTDEFRAFRELNASESMVGTVPFNTLGNSVEAHLRDFEQVLTKNMLKKAMGLEKTVSAFYDIAYRYFPYYHRIESE